MNPVPHYQLIEFLEWITHNDPRRDIKELDREILNRMALEYLRGGGRRGDFSGSINILNIFQICPMISESDIQGQMKHFSGCGRCFDYIYQRSHLRPNHVELHPFLEKFALYAQRYELPIILEPIEREFGEPARNDRDDFRNHEKELANYLESYGKRLFEIFQKYINQTDPREIDDYLIYHSEIMRSEGRQPIPDDHPFKGRQVNDGMDDGTEPLNSNRDIQSEAHRLVDSLLLLMQGGFYERYLERQPEMLHFLAKLNIISQHGLQAVEFLSWLQDNHPKIDILASAPTGEIRELALEFCEKNGYLNSVSFSREVLQWVNGKGERNIIQRLVDIGRNAKQRGDSYKWEVSPFERYKQIPFHAVFLFLSAGDFPTFVKKFWEDLNHLSGDYLDIYYSSEDVERRISGYEAVKEFRSIRLEPMSLPALILWADSLHDASVIPLENLSHEDVFGLIKLIVQNVKDKKTLGDISLSAKEYVSGKVPKPLPQFQLYFSGEISMGDKYDFRNANINNTGGQVFIGRLKDVIANLNASGHQDFGNVLQELSSAIEASKHLSDDQKQEVLELVRQLGEESAKQKPNKTLLKTLGDGIMVVLKSIPDVAKAVGALMPLLSSFLK